MGAHISICVASYVYNLFVLAKDSDDAYNKVKSAFNEVNGFELNALPNGNLQNNYTVYRICIANGTDFAFVVVNSINDDSVTATIEAVKSKLQSRDLSKAPDYNV